MKRPPIIATLVVLAAVATMIALGLWQLRRAAWKDGLLKRYAAASTLPPIAFPALPDEGLLFRRASGFCLEVTHWTVKAGRNVAGQPGWGHLAECRTNGGEGPGMRVDVGWSASDATPRGWKGGPVSGVIGPDRQRKILLVADKPAPGLMVSAPPDIEAIPNNHRAYAVQWFLFAGVAAVIYLIALRRRIGRLVDGKLVDSPPGG